MGQRDIHLHKTSFFPPPHYTQLITQQCHVSNICRVGCSQTSGKLFSDKWLFLLQVISCLLPLQKKEKDRTLLFFCLKEANTFHISVITYGQLVHACEAGVFTVRLYTCVWVHLCVSLQCKHIIGIRMCLRAARTEKKTWKDHSGSPQHWSNLGNTATSRQQNPTNKIQF